MIVFLAIVLAWLKVVPDSLCVCFINIIWMTTLRVELQLSVKEIE